jgi:serine/threonine protein kinase
MVFGPPGGPLGAARLLLDDAENIALTIVRSPDGTNVGLKAILKKFPFVVGHGSVDFDLFFDPAVSREHFEIDYLEGRFTIRDLGSTNGTFVNGARLKPMTHEALFFGVHILMGSNTQLIFGPSESREMPDLRGKTIGGRFTLVERLHGSAKSAVYLATDGKLPRKVAVKILSPGLARYTGYREQFSREAETASQIRHPNICRVLDYGDSGVDDPAIRDSLYVCTEFLEGGSLANRLDSNEVFALDRVSSWVVRICDALQHIHDRGITHSGLKPSAIIFDEDGNPFLTDFALATRVGVLGNRGFLGTPKFLSPEQFDGEAPIPASDQYSLAVLAYLLLSGGEPYQGQDDPEIRRRNFRRGPLPVHEMCAHNGRTPVPEAVSTVLSKAMSVNHKDRFEKISEFGKAFELAKVKSTGDHFLPSAFISYQRAISAPWAINLKWRLEKEYGIKAFVDSQREDKGGQFPPKLQSSIENTDVFVCLLAGSTLNSEWVKREIDIAHRAKKPMIPVFQESFHHPEDMPSLEPCLRELLMFEGIILLDEQNIYIDDAIRDLSKCIRQLASSATRSS